MPALQLRSHLPHAQTALTSCLIGMLMVLVSGCRLPSGPAAAEPAISALLALGAERIDRQLTDTELDLPLDMGAGKTPSLRAQLVQGDVVILHFWASWCPPCIEELPRIHQLAIALQGRRARVVSVSHDDTWEDAAAAVAKAAGAKDPQAGVWLREVEGQSGNEGQMLRVRMGTAKLPETYILQGDHILTRLIASQNWADPRMIQALHTLAPTR